jgi:leader peptidase (prepilin peptidase)/N-methyltransferase
VLTVIAIPRAAGGIFAFAFGCAVGSFLNVVIWRLPRGMSINNPPRSICPQCKSPIAFNDNIPILSFIFLRGKCRCCGAPISPRYLAVEVLTGLLFLAIFAVERTSAFVGPGQAVVMALLVSLLVAASAIDIEFLIIPDEISVFGLVGGLVAGFLLPEIHVGPAAHHTWSGLTSMNRLDGLLAALVGAGGGGGLVAIFAVLGAAVFRREAIGIGDVKLMAMVGAFFGWKVAFIAFFIAPFAGLLYGIPLLVMKGKHVMPYGPFLSAASVLTVLFRPAACGVLERYITTLRELAGMIF